MFEYECIALVSACIMNVSMLWMRLASRSTSSHSIHVSGDIFSNWWTACISLWLNRYVKDTNMLFQFSGELIVWLGCISHHRLKKREKKKNNKDELDLSIRNWKMVLLSCHARFFIVFQSPCRTWDALRWRPEAWRKVQ